MVLRRRRRGTMTSQDLIVAPTQGRPPALIEGSGRKARDRNEHFLPAESVILKVQPSLPFAWRFPSSQELPRESFVEACERPQVQVHFRNARANTGSPLTPFADRLPHLLNDIWGRQRG